MTGRTFEISPPQPIGLPFDYWLRVSRVRNHRDALATASEFLPDPFNDAADFHDPVGWRLLIHAGSFPWAVACNPSWDPRPDIATLADTGAQQVPADFIGGDPEDAVGGIRLDLVGAQVDVARAAWLVIGFVQSLQLSVSEILTIRWWEPRVWKRALHGYLPLP